LVACSLEKGVVYFQAPVSHAGRANSLIVCPPPFADERWAEKRCPPYTTRSFSMEYESAFLIRNPDQILSKLSILLKNKCLLTAYYGDNDDSFITTILEINIKNNLLIFYHSPKQDAIEQLLDSPIITFKTEYLGIKVAFDTIRIAKTQHQGVSVFAIPIPGSILWIEARDFYRVKAPASKSGYCRLTLKDQKPIDLKLYDISLVGFSMLTDSKEVSDLMIPDTHFEQCKLILANTGEGAISFEVRSKYIIDPENSDRIEKIGCKFTQITPAFENIIQRYMQQIERENRQKT
jgi:c-di-GMP-binding flagellar brake protein YcgR